MTAQADLRVEAAHLRRFRHNFRVRTLPCTWAPPNQRVHDRSKTCSAAQSVRLHSCQYLLVMHTGVVFLTVTAFCAVTFNASIMGSSSLSIISDAPPSAGCLYRSLQACTCLHVI